MIRDRIATPQAIDYVRQQVAKRLARLGREGGASLAALDRELAGIEAKIERLITAIENGTDSEYVIERHDRLVAEARSKRAQMDSLSRQLRQPASLLTPDEITARVFDTESLISAEPRAGREALRRLLDGGVVRMEPLPEAGYVARCDLLTAGPARRPIPPGLAWGDGALLG